MGTTVAAQGTRPRRGSHPPQGTRKGYPYDGRWDPLTRVRGAGWWWGYMGMISYMEIWPPLDKTGQPLVFSAASESESALMME